MNATVDLDLLQKALAELRTAGQVGLADALAATIKPQAFSTIAWPTQKRVGRCEDMGSGHVQLDLDADNDVVLTVWDGEKSSTVEFCNPGGGGGGRSSKTRLALIELMRAIEADNFNSPGFAHPPEKLKKEGSS